MRRAGLVSPLRTLLVLACVGCADVREAGLDPLPGIDGGQLEDESGGGDGTADDDDDDDDGADEGDPKLDIGSMGDGDGCAERGGSGGVAAGEFSYIWIANSAQGTVTKIDTREGVELARYRTSSTPGNPSRTSVNLYGDVAVMNREGSSVARIAARAADCRGPSTSSGPDDIKPFGEDDCMLWWQPLGASGAYEDGPRPVAWEGGTDACDSNPRLWVGWTDTAAAVTHVKRLDGATGDTLDELQIPGWTFGVAPIGAYGGAANKAGDFWIVGLAGPLVRVDATSLAVEVIPRRPDSYFYGIALDEHGNPWMGDLSGVSWTYDVATATMRKNPMAGARGRGIMVDRSGRAWMPVHTNPNPTPGSCSLAEIDTATGAVVTNHPLAGCVEPVGVAVDVDDYVWVVDKGANRAYKFDPELREVSLTVDTLDGPYTYSDMTGSGLDLVVNPPTG
jgi:DNA-binding beta-propeller fold protein YncE